MKKLFITLGIAAILTSCVTNETELKMSHNNLDFKVPAGKMTPETLWSFGRVGGVNLSPDRAELLYTITWYNIAENKSYREIYKQSIEGGERIQLTNTPDFNEGNAIWRPDGKKIGYLSSKSGSTQMWEMDVDGSNQTIISDVEGGIEGFSYAPDGTKVSFIKTVKIYDDIHDKYADLDKANAKIVDDLMYRHWDHWVDGKFSHVFVADFDGSKLSNIKDIMPKEPWESPVRPFGGMEQVVWTPDSKNLTYVSRKKEGMAYATSTNTDIYLYNLASGKTTNLTEGNVGYDNHAVFSNDGKWMAYESMERDGYEADVNRLALMNMETKEVKYLTDNNTNVGSLSWNDNNTAIYYISDWHARDHVYRFDLESNTPSQMTEGDYDYHSVAFAGDKLVTTRVSMSKPQEIYTVNIGDKSVTEISLVNKPILDQITMGEVKERWVKTTDNKDMLVWVIYPPNFDPNKKYPTLLYCQGGPQGTVSQFWSYRWNFQMMAANDYIIVAPNRRGLPGFGKDWNEEVSGDYGGQCMRDYLSAIDDVAKEPYVDTDHLGCVGASFGGFSVFYLAGHHDKRFKAFIAHDGMFNFESMYLETEEMWFVNFDIGGPFWDKKNKQAQKSYTFSPHLSVDKWDTPIMVFQGGKDYRVTESQGFMAFNAAKLKGLEARLVYFPEENHWVLGCQNGILWQREFFDWLDHYLK